MKYYLTKLVVSLGLLATAYGQPNPLVREATPGASLPATCAVGERFFKTTATAGQNLYGCTSTNTWTLESGSATMIPKADATATYLFLDADRSKRIVRSFATAMSDALPQANGSTFVSGWQVDVLNNGPGAETITPTVSTFQGSATAIILYAGQFAHIVSDGTNYTASGSFVLCSTCAGTIELAAGTAPSIVANTAIHYAPTSVTGYTLRELAAACTGILLLTNTANDMVPTCLASTGTGNAVRANNAVMDSLTVTTSCTGCGSRSSISSAGLGVNAPWGGGFSSAVSITANVPIYQQFVQPFGQTVTKIGIYLGTIAAANSIAYGIYDSTCTLITGATGRFTGAAGAGSQTITLTTPPTLTDVGVYYLGIATEDAAATIGSTATVQLVSAFNLGTDRRFFTGASAPTGTGVTYALPASCGAKTVSTNPILFGVLLP